MERLWNYAIFHTQVIGAGVGSWGETSVMFYGLGLVSGFSFNFNPLGNLIAEHD